MITRRSPIVLTSTTSTRFTASAHSPQSVCSRKFEVVSVAHGSGLLQVMTSLAPRFPVASNPTTSSNISPSPSAGTGPNISLFVQHSIFIMSIIS